MPAHAQHMGVDHRRADIGMAEQFLHGADVVARLQQVGGEGMAQVCGVAGLWMPAASRARAKGALEITCSCR
jgi:hypothetical protein